MVGADRAELSDEDVAAAAAALQLQDECWLLITVSIIFIFCRITCYNFTTL